MREYRDASAACEKRQECQGCWLPSLCGHVREHFCLCQVPVHQESICIREFKPSYENAECRHSDEDNVTPSDHQGFTPRRATGHSSTRRAIALQNNFRFDDESQPDETTRTGDSNPINCYFVRWFLSISFIHTVSMKRALPSWAAL